VAAPEVVEDRQERARLIRVVEVLERDLAQAVDVDDGGLEVLDRRLELDDQPAVVERKA
jgi:hypothetical protein